MSKVGVKNKIFSIVLAICAGLAPVILGAIVWEFTGYLILFPIVVVGLYAPILMIFELFAIIKLLEERDKGR